MSLLRCSRVQQRSRTVAARCFSSHDAKDSKTNLNSDSARFPFSLSKAKGTEYSEALAESKGHSYFSLGPLIGSLGKLKKPVVVKSAEISKIVGCSGGGSHHDSHPILWFTIHEGPKHACPSCGQIFVLETTAKQSISEKLAHFEHEYQHVLPTTVSSASLTKYKQQLRTIAKEKPKKISLKFE